MELLFICIVLFLLIIGVIGSFIPVIPGPPISFIGLLVSNFYIHPLEDEIFLWLMAFVVVAVTVLDLWVQIYGVKKFGGGKLAVRGSVIGLILGIIFIPVIGIIIGPFLGAFVGSKMENKDVDTSIKIALGTLAGFLVGSMLKLSVSLYIIYIIFQTFPSL